MARVLPSFHFDSKRINVKHPTFVIIEDRECLEGKTY